MTKIRQEREKLLVRQRNVKKRNKIIENYYIERKD
jgi:hypothetical protein